MEMKDFDRICEGKFVEMKDFDRICEGKFVEMKDFDRICECKEAEVQTCSLLQIHQHSEQNTNLEITQKLRKI